jgi:hypothetical protein
MSFLRNIWDTEGPLGIPMKDETGKGKQERGQERGHEEERGQTPKRHNHTVERDAVKAPARDGLRGGWQVIDPCQRKGQHAREMCHGQRLPSVNSLRGRHSDGCFPGPE